MARRLLISGLLLSATALATPTSFPQQTALPQSQNTSTVPFTPNNSTLFARDGGWSPAVALQDGSGVCPQWAYINCQSITSNDYCCGAGTYCAYGGPENHIGCCADSAVCTGYPPGATTTVYVPSATATTWWTQSGTTATGLIGPAYTVTTTTTATQYVTGASPTICETLYAHGDNLPTTAAAQCGLVLVLNAAPGRNVDGVALAAGLAVANGLASILGWLGLL